MKSNGEKDKNQMIFFIKTVLFTILQNVTETKRFTKFKQIVQLV